MASHSARQVNKIAQPSELEFCPETLSHTPGYIQDIIVDRLENLGILHEIEFEKSDTGEESILEESKKTSSFKTDTMESEHQSHVSAPQVMSPP